uniref:Adaptor related protein complex 1 subunit sigma 3a n=1 Tax=Sinocyclocheilus grahami TaxID=75366 RepID=A0A672NIN8_SINGR
MTKHVVFYLCVFCVCELDIIFNFEKAYFILDEFVIGGKVQETSKASVAKSMEGADSLQESVSSASSLSGSRYRRICSIVLLSNPVTAFS